MFYSNQVNVKVQYFPLKYGRGKEESFLLGKTCVSVC